MPDHREIERTYTASSETVVPDLTQLSDVASVDAPETVELSAIYFDTRDLALLRAGVSLRRRTGGSDEGWHLKVPAGAGRDEIQVPLTGQHSSPPEELGTAVLGWTRGTALEVVALIATRRTIHVLRDTNGLVLAELADDWVTGNASGVADVVQWREWEIELVGAGPDLLDEAQGLLAHDGIEPSKVQRKIELVLALRAPATLAPGAPGRGRPAGRVLHRRLAAEVAELLLADSVIRRRGPGGVHRARVACRRLRNALATFRPLLDREITDPVRGELQWLAHELGEARDVEVIHERVRSLVGLEEKRYVVGPVRERIDRTYGDWADAARTGGDTALASDRYFELLAALERLVAEPPWTSVADNAARDVLPALVRKDWKRLRRRVQALEVAEDHDVALHDVRKAAKRLRYAAEPLAPLWGKGAKRVAKGAQRITQILGELQDTAVSRRHLLLLADAAAADGENAFTYGRLHAREATRAAELEREFERAFRSLGKRSTC